MVQIQGFSDIQYLKKYFLDQYQQYFTEIKKNNKYPEIFISSSIAHLLHVKKNDWINIIIPNEKDKSISSHFKIFSVQIKSIFLSKKKIYSNNVLIPLKFFNNFLDLNNTLAQIEINMSNPFHAENIILHAINQVDYPLAAYTWINTYKHLYNDIQSMKTIVYLSISIIIIISCFNITAISFISILQKTKEIAILKSMGASNRLIQLIFLYYGLRFIIISTLLGLLIGIITILNFNDITYYLEKIFRQNIILHNLYHAHFLLLKLHTFDIIMILVITVFIGIITNLYPSYYATTINPSKILKEY
ncbi:FtsX-like permease family protein [Buchnera aphidicola]|uniref:FtsX-like permease family protein n=1 Tax=Buchnera aphidicola TaxID=9 RepID=UPI003BEEF85C